MYTGTLIDELIKTVQHAETESKTKQQQRQIGMTELQLFMQQMNCSQNLRHIRVGIA